MGTESESEADAETAMDQIDVVRTVKLPLETSTRKNERVREAIDDWQAVTATMADYIPTFPPSRWSGRDSHLTRLAAQVTDDDTCLYAHDRNEAAYAVQQAFHSWYERGRPGDRPREFGDGDHIRLCSCCTKPTRRVEVVPNERGYGLQVKVRNREDPLWFHINGGEYQAGFLEELTDGGRWYGSLELHLDDGKLIAHLSTTNTVDVYAPDDVDTRIGVDLGENTLYAAVVVDEDKEIAQVEMKSGREFRHQRERLDRRRKQLSAEGDLAGVRSSRGDRRRYTEHVTHNASRQIVELAIDHAPAVIYLEDLTGYRESADDAIHDWPQGMLREQIAYKATSAGIPVREIDPSGTSITCRKCGQQDPHARDGNTFYCGRCRYEVHSDVNAAANIAMRTDLH